MPPQKAAELLAAFVSEEINIIKRVEKSSYQLGQDLFRIAAGIGVLLDAGEHLVEDFRRLLRAHRHSDPSLPATRLS